MERGGLRAARDLSSASHVPGRRALRRRSSFADGAGATAGCLRVRRRFAGELRCRSSDRYPIHVKRRLRSQGKEIARVARKEVRRELAALRKEALGHLPRGDRRAEAPRARPRAPASPARQGSAAFGVPRRQRGIDLAGHPLQPEEHGLAAATSRPVGGRMRPSDRCVGTVDLQLGGAGPPLPGAPASGAARSAASGECASCAGPPSRAPSGRRAAHDAAARWRSRPRPRR